MDPHWEKSVNPNNLEILPSQSHLFDLPSEVAYLNCAYMSPQLRSISETGVKSVKQKEKPWKISADDWFDQTEKLRSLIAQLMNAEADGVAIIPAASYGIAIAAANIPIRKGQNIVILGEQFPSNVYSWREAAVTRNAEVRTVQKKPDEAWTNAVLEAINENTAVVAVPNCHWTDGALVDLVQVGKRTREAGAALVVDASQSFGAYPIDVKTVQPDFLVSVGYKWQFGPYSLGYLYASPKWRGRGKPLESSWLTRAKAEDFANLVNYTDEYRPGARRFDMGEYSQFVLTPMALKAAMQLLEWGVERIQSTLSRFTNIIANEVKAIGCNVLPPDKRVGHMMGVRFPQGIPGKLPKKFKNEQIFVSIRGDAIRVSPHVYNCDEDIARLLSILKEFT